MPWNRFGVVGKGRKKSRGLLAFFLSQNPANRNRTSDHLMAAAIYSQMLYQLSYSRLGGRIGRWLLEIIQQCLRSEQNVRITSAATPLNEHGNFYILLGAAMLQRQVWMRTFS
jgi:hypothetical protein